MAPRSFQSFIFLRSIIWVPGTPRVLVEKSKLYPNCGSAALRHLKPIHKKDSQFFKLIIKRQIIVCFSASCKKFSCNDSTFAVYNFYFNFSKWLSLTVMYKLIPMKLNHVLYLKCKIFIDGVIQRNESLYSHKSKTVNLLRHLFVFVLLFPFWAY